jgi:RNA polymerase sigma-70 factor (ECF subfamily)
MSTRKLSQSTRGIENDHNSFKVDLCNLVPFMRAFARSLTRDRESADDLVQDTLLKAWNARVSFEPGTNLKSWVFMILRNQFYSDRRRAWRQVAWDQEAAEQIPGSTNEQLWNADLSDTAAALSQLVDEQREALILVAAAGFSYEQAAAICGCAVGTVKSRVARARKALVAILDGNSQSPSQSVAERRSSADSVLAEIARLSVIAAPSGAEGHAGA